MADSQNLIGQGMGIAMDEIWRALFGNAVVNARQGQPITAGDVGDTAFTVGLNSLPFGGGGAAARASRITPEGLNALDQVLRMQRKTYDPITRVVPEAARGNKSVGLYGPGTYHSSKDASMTHWRTYGDTVQKPKFDPKGYLQIAQSKGFKPTGEMKGNPAQMDINSPEIRQLMDEGYIGLASSDLPARKGISDATTLFDPAAFSGARYKTVGKQDPTTNFWVNPTLPQRAENAYREALARYIGGGTKGDVRMFGNAWTQQGNRTLNQFAKRKAMRQLREKFVRPRQGNVVQRVAEPEA